MDTKQERDGGMNWEIGIDTCTLSISRIKYIGASQAALAVKNLPANAGDIRVACLIPGSGRPPCERVWQPTLVFSLRESHGQRSLMGYSP